MKLPSRMLGRCVSRVWALSMVTRLLLYVKLNCCIWIEVLKTLLAHFTGISTAPKPPPDIHPGWFPAIVLRSVLFYFVRSNSSKACENCYGISSRLLAVSLRKDPINEHVHYMPLSHQTEPPYLYVHHPNLAPMLFFGYAQQFPGYTNLSIP